MLLQEANVHRAEDVRVGVVQQALSYAWWSGSDVRRASQAPGPHACTQPHAPDGHAVLLVAWLMRRRPRVRRRPSLAGRRRSQGAGGPRALAAGAGARLEWSMVAQ